MTPTRHQSACVSALSDFVQCLSRNSYRTVTPPTCGEVAGRSLFGPSSKYREIDTFLIHSNSICQFFVRAEFESLTSSVELSNAQLLNVFESFEFDLINSQSDEFQMFAYGINHTLGYGTQCRPFHPAGGGGCTVSHVSLFCRQRIVRACCQQCARASALALFQYVVPRLMR